MEKWTDLFISVCDRHAPVKTGRTRPSKSLWITIVSKRRMNFRDLVKGKAIKTRDPSAWSQFRKTKNQGNREIMSAKMAYDEIAFNSCAKDQRKTWQTVSELTSRKSNKTVMNEIQYQGKKSKSQVDVAELLTSFKIGPKC